MPKQRPNTARHESGKSRFPDFGYRISNFGFSSRSGQALIETDLALVALMAIVFAALVQLSRLGRARTEALMEARREAGQNALSDTYAQPNPAPTFIYNWDVGGDERSHSADDTARNALSQTVDNGLLAPAHPDDLSDACRAMPSPPAGTRPVVMGFDLVHGREQSDRIELLPVVRRLLYDAEDIRITSDAWLTWTREIP
jgi:hypothetical protein